MGGRCLCATSGCGEGGVGDGSSLSSRIVACDSVCVCVTAAALCHPFCRGAAAGQDTLPTPLILPRVPASGPAGRMEAAYPVGTAGGPGGGGRHAAPLGRSATQPESFPDGSDRVAAEGTACWAFFSFIFFFRSRL